MNMTYIITTTVTVIGTLAGSKAWEYFFKAQSKNLEIKVEDKRQDHKIDTDNVRLLIHEIYGGTISNLQAELAKYQAKLERFEGDLNVAHNQIRQLDRKVVLYESHLSQTKKGKAFVEEANTLLKIKYQ